MVFLKARTGPQSRAGFHTTAREPKRGHFRAPALQTPPKFHERTPKRERRKKEICGGREKKKSEILGGPAEGGVRVRGGPGEGEEEKRAQKGTLSRRLKTMSSPLNFCNFY